MDIQINYIIDRLTSNSVSILKKNFIELNGELQQIGENSRKAYMNTVEDRIDLKNDIPEE
jgi:hypothetical protein